ncbi:twitching motility protein PilT [Microbacterium sp. CH12i]|uniref:type II toxin-antitoxin system VapC family toxin n=1 Tax=Microbacterium sp. CH12i TaxID=1479651 RepID=UPI0004613B5C|nr:type II toxin-antitoxin system VapC family toxin [Microbacterium sp. CH12i]KDA06016.1 twitching motility protein PilT [Microbacterium sp. CH12i]
MIVYLDTSALLPLVIAEPGSPVSKRLWKDAHEVVSTRLVVVEAAAALAQSERIGRTSAAALADHLEEAQLIIADATLLDVTTTVINRAAEIAVTRGLRGYDAVHLATATLIRARDVVFASGDQRLLTAAAEERFTTVDTSGRANSAAPV